MKTREMTSAHLFVYRMSRRLVAAARLAPTTTATPTPTPKPTAAPAPAPAPAPAQFVQR